MRPEMNEKHGRCNDGSKEMAQNSNERSPLLERVPVGERQPYDRYPHQTLRRFCTLALTGIPVLTLVIVAFCVAVTGQRDFFGDHRTESSSFLTDVFRHPHLPHAEWPKSKGISYAELKQILIGTPSAASARKWSQYYTSGPHLTGQNLSQAVWTRDKWQEWGIGSRIDSYDVYLNYPLDHRLALMEDGKVTFEATLEEDMLEEDPTTLLEDRVPVFHGYSANGNVTASFVYCNYGTYQDFEDLKSANVSLEGKVALIKYGGIFRGLKAKRASEMGMVGVILYTDPGDDGEMTEENGYKTYPSGPARNPSSVQRGSMEYLSVAPGDPTTIGYPSLPGVPRQSTDGKIPDIPSLPISYAEAVPLLRALNGQGPNVSTFPPYWQKNLGLRHKGVQYNIGPTPANITVNVMNKQNYTITPLWNVIGVINGSISDEVVVIGCHRDAWIAGGAGDPNSGSAALNEIVRSFGTAIVAGWRPLRTIVFASWDGEEYGLLGSTEWVEEFIPWLSKSTVTYINLDTGSSGPYFETAATPLLNPALFEVTSQVLSPNQTVVGQTVRDVWDGKIDTMGSGSDFTAFQDFAGISCVHVGFRAGLNSPVYHYHSNYDSFHWMETYGDPGFAYHATIAQIGGLLVAKFAEEPVVGFSAREYAEALEKYVNGLRKFATETNSDYEPILDVDVENGKPKLHDIFLPLDQAVQHFHRAASEFDGRAAKLVEMLTPSKHDHSSRTISHLYKQARKINTAYKYLDRQFLYEKGLDSRSWFKHVVFAPGLWTGYAGATFPGIVEALEFGNRSDVNRWVGLVTQRVEEATRLLR